MTYFWIYTEKFAEVAASGEHSWKIKTHIRIALKNYLKVD